MKKLMRHLGLATLLLSLSLPAMAEGLLMARTDNQFPEAMTLLQSAIAARGYKITRLQEVNENLAKRDFKSDMYRVVYFGKLDEVKAVTASHPELIPFLPLNITIFAEGDQAILVASHPKMLEQFFPDPKLKPIFDHWEADILSILNELREAK
ncbi:DUF302 domain-containing protein [Sulfuriferula nivalis]|uniref:DUF302 domain-containing protein n=1 Tax=Sulfuriferula nivalis TaxID=2675298 RepID=A0A809RDC9_9PROT|nr:DUF302 domain-containing protein [Sulfuriferula nivalis]BBO99655.1 hypothetical protein SFSGTM_03640 [Sulfuriferula nivalis]